VRKIEYAVGAAGAFIRALHREDFDRGMIATFGERFRIVQGFTGDGTALYRALGGILLGAREPQSRLYDSLEDLVRVFWQEGHSDRPWLLAVITDGMDTSSAKYRGNPSGIGRFIGANFNHEPSNFIFVIGVGDNQQVDAQGLARMGVAGGFPAVTIEAFPMLMEVFIDIAVEVTGQLVGRRVSDGVTSWDEVAQIYRVAQTPLDYAFLIDVSTSMDELGDAGSGRIV
jgi:hypothetical protein